jgi:hypothetical protein
MIGLQISFDILKSFWKQLIYNYLLHEVSTPLYQGVSVYFYKSHIYLLFLRYVMYIGNEVVEVKIRKT